MKGSTSTATRRTIKGIATLFDDTERKQLFRKYLFFLGWVEVAILVITVLYQLGNQGYDQNGPIPIPFPWKMYFVISFLTPGGDHVSHWGDHCRVQQILHRS